MYSIGLDVGIASCGFSVIDDTNGKIVELGSNIFSSVDPTNNKNVEILEGIDVFLLGEQLDLMMLKRF